MRYPGVGGGGTTLICEDKNKMGVKWDVKVWAEFNWAKAWPLVKKLMNFRFSIKRDNSSARRLSQLQISCRDALRAMATSTKDRLDQNRKAFPYIPCYRHVTSTMKIFLVLGRSSLLVSSALSLGRSRHQIYFHCR